ncbi:hypothetical protein BOX30_11375 [Leptospirillum ferriphilum]|nr:hypothetical protein BOX30_11375 [Leptospirillum ferriphilum]
MFFVMIEVIDVLDSNTEKVIEVYFDVVNFWGIVLEKFATEEARIYIKNQRLLNQSPRIRS